jgi:hypothetical protein
MGQGNQVITKAIDHIKDQIDQQVDTACQARLVSLVYSIIPNFIAERFATMQPCDKLNCTVYVIDGIGCSRSSPNLKCATAPGSPGTPYGQICSAFPIEKVADEMQCPDCTQ